MTAKISKYTVQIVGVGGQGVLLASMVLGNAAMKEGYQVAMSEVHGMAQRGGSVLCTLRFGSTVVSPLEANGGADLLMGFEPAETCRNLPLANKGTMIVMNLDPVLPSMVAAGMEEYPKVDDLLASARSECAHVTAIDATSIAKKAGKAVAANAAMIGAVAAVDGFPLSKEVLRETLKENVPAKFLDLNLKAFDLGYEAAKQ
jgi:indolepyruvate ferredoxin oxidoreductase beta subunit